MAITNLTGYKWKPNNSVYITSAKTYNIIGNGVSQQRTFETTTFELVRRTQINEYSGQTEYVVGLYLRGGEFDNFIAGIAYWCNSSSSSFYPSTAATADYNATITFVGGTDITNTELISWLEANGTLEKMVVPITQLAPFLTSIANAIRTKKGTSAQINAQNFESEIESIESGGAGATQYILKTYLNTNGLIGATINGVYYPVNNEFSYDPYAGVKCIGFVYDGWFSTVSKCTNLYNLTKGAVATTSNLSRKDILILIGDAELYGEF